MPNPTHNHIVNCFFNQRFPCESSSGFVNECEIVKFDKLGSVELDSNVELLGSVIIRSDALILFDVVFYPDDLLVFYVIL